jgi:DNA-binding transcriptional ArsR family regulator
MASDRFAIPAPQVQRILCKDLLHATVGRVTTDGRTDLSALRALSHPLRLELLDRLRTEGPATASLLAQRVGESSGATSYHLRQLARYGFVEEDTRDAKGRERWWRHRERELDLPRGSATTSALLGAMLERERAVLDRYVAQRERLPEWEDASFFSSRVCRMTPERLAELNRGVQALTDQLMQADDDAAAPDARPVRILALGFPQPDAPR